LYSALHGIQTTLKRSGMDHTAFNLQRTPCQPSPRKRSPDGASTECGDGHLIAAHYSFICTCVSSYARKVVILSVYLMSQCNCANKRIREDYVCVSVFDLDFFISM